MQYNNNNNDITDQKQFNNIANQLRVEINRRQRQQDLQHLHMNNSMAAGRFSNTAVNVLPGMNVTQTPMNTNLPFRTAYQQQQYFPTAPPNPVLHHPVNRMGGSGSMALSLPSP